MKAIGIILAGGNNNDQYDCRICSRRILRRNLLHSNLAGGNIAGICGAGRHGGRIFPGTSGNEAESACSDS